MRKKLFIVLLTSSIIFSSCGNKPDNSTTSSKTAAPSNTETPKDTSSSDTLDDLESIGDVEVEKTLFSVELKIPADFMGGTTQEELDKTAKEHGYQSITLNDDGSATYIMTKAQHEELMQEMVQNINSELEKMIGSEDYPNFTEIKANDDFTSFEIKTKSKELDLNESISSLVFYTFGGMYNIFNGTKADNIHLDYINDKTDKIIESYDSSKAQ